MAGTVAEVARELVDEQVDGRHARRDRNREAVVDALLDLYREGNLAPSSEEIAERAGLSPRSLFRYFDDIEDLTRAAIARQQDRIVPLLDARFDVGRPFPERVTAFVEGRLRLVEAMGAVAHVARLRAPFQPLVAAQLTQVRAAMRRQVKKAFAPELAALGSAASSALAAADVICSYEGCQLLRHDQALSRSRTSTVLTDSLTRLFAMEDR